jgi:predicted phosphodiesterase
MAERSYGAPAEPIVDAGSVARLAVIGDVHGNAVAFAAVLEELRRDPPELVVVNGDLSWGPEPEETFVIADSLETVLFVRGNAESELVEGTNSETGAWMVARHRPARLAQIATFVGSVAVQVEGVGRVFVCHGSPRGDQELVTQGTPEARMRGLLGGTTLDVLVTAHTHLQFERKVLGITSMNAGSVGLQYGGTPAAYWATIGPDVELRRTEYDVEEAVRRVRASGIPTADRIVQTLLEPPSTEEVIGDAERLVASD